MSVLFPVLKPLGDFLVVVDTTANGTSVVGAVHFRAFGPRGCLLRVVGLRGNRKVGMVVMLALVNLFLFALDLFIPPLLLPFLCFGFGCIGSTPGLGLGLFISCICLRLVTRPSLAEPVANLLVCLVVTQFGHALGFLALLPEQPAFPLVAQLVGDANPTFWCRGFVLDRRLSDVLPVELGAGVVIRRGDTVASARPVVAFPLRLGRRRRVLLVAAPAVRRRRRRRELGARVVGVVRVRALS